MRWAGDERDANSTNHEEAVNRHTCQSATPSHEQVRQKPVRSVSWTGDEKKKLARGKKKEENHDNYEG